MKPSPYLLSFFLGASAIVGGQPLTGPAPAPDGWSDPEQFTIPTDSGTTTAIRRSYARYTRPYVPRIDCAYLPGGGAVLFNFAPRAGQWHYFTAGRLMSVHARAFSLHFLKGQTVPDGETVDSFAEKWLDDYKGRGPAAGIYQEVAVSLILVFGRRAVMPLDPMLEADCTIESILPSKDKFTLKLRGVNGDALEASFSTDLKLLSAAQNGQSLTPLLDGQTPRGTPPWSQRKVTVASASGPITAQACDRAFDAPGGAHVRYGVAAMRAQVPHAPTVRVLVMPTGEVWVGPSFCKLAQLGDKIIGFTVFRQTGELMAFAGPRSRIAMADGERIAAVRNILTQVEGQMALGQMAPNKSLKLAGLFGDDPVLAQDTDLEVANVSVEANDLVVTVNTLQSRETITLQFTPDLSLLSQNRAPRKP